jgi:hypothetical protein
MSESEREALLIIHALLRGAERQLYHAFVEGTATSQALATRDLSRSVEALEDFFDAQGWEYEEE